jgi:hypothetical protein
VIPFGNNISRLFKFSDLKFKRSKCDHIKQQITLITYAGFKCIEQSNI